MSQAGVISISGGGGGTDIIKWVVTSATSISMVAGTGYICTSGSAITATLPTACATGIQMGLVATGAGAITIAQNAGQLIRFGNQVSTTGITGSWTSTAQGDAMILLCFVAAAASAGSWIVPGQSQGNWTPA